jgi:hypothetical protein
MTYPSISSLVRGWFATEPPHPETEPRVYGQQEQPTTDYRKLHGEAMGKLMRAQREHMALEARAVRAERKARETWDALEREHAAHVECGDRCQGLTRDLENARGANEALAGEVRALNLLLAGARRATDLWRRKFRRERAWHKRTEAALHETAVELEDLRNRTGLNK